MLTRVVLPWRYRAADFVYRCAEAVGVSPLKLRPEGLIRRAEKLVPGERVDVEAVREPLAILCNSMEDDVQLQIFGRRTARHAVLQALVARMRLAKMRRERPEIFDTPLNDPVIVVGLARSGTTFLHRLLSAAPEARGFAAWELREPIPGEVDHRREREEAAFQWMNKHAQAMQTIHYSSPDTASECYPLLNPSLVSPGFAIPWRCASYMHWLTEQDLSQSYAYYRSFLQLLQSENPDRRLTMKSPAHLPFLEELVNATPEAKIVYIHRPPEETISSAASLSLASGSMVSRRFDPPRSAAVAIQIAEFSLERAARARESLGKRLSICDVEYEDLRRSPVETIAEIHRVHDLPWTEETRERVRSFAEENPQHKRGRHRHAPEDFGLTRAELAERFSQYSERSAPPRRATG